MYDGRYQALGELLRLEREKVCPQREKLTNYLHSCWVVTFGHSENVIRKIENGTFFGELEKMVSSPSLTIHPQSSAWIRNPSSFNKRPQQIADYCQALSLTPARLRRLLREAGLPPTLASGLPESYVPPYRAKKDAFSTGAQEYHRGKVG